MIADESEAAPGSHGLMSVERTASVIRAVEQSDKANLVDISRLAGLNEATTLRYLNTLVSLGYLERSDDSRYRLGWELFRLGQRASESFFPRDLVRPILSRLSREHEQTVLFGFRKDDALVIADAVESSRILRRIAEPGQLELWHTSSIGKAIMSTMPDAEWEGILRRVGMERFTERTITTRKRMAAEIALTRERGYSMSREEYEKDLIGLAAPVPSQSGSSQFALSISFLSHRLPDDKREEVGEQLKNAAREISALLR